MIVIVWINIDEYLKLTGLVNDQSGLKRKMMLIKITILSFWQIKLSSMENYNYFSNCICIYQQWGKIKNMSSQSPQNNWIKPVFVWWWCWAVTSAPGCFSPVYSVLLSVPAAWRHFLSAALSSPLWHIPSPGVYKVSTLSLASLID